MLTHHANMGILAESLLVGLCVLAAYEVAFPVCKKCRGRTRRWDDCCQTCEQAAK